MCVLDAIRSVIEEIGEGAEEVDLGGRSVAMRAYASWFNFKGADQQKSVGVLSGGERNRLQLAKVTCGLLASSKALYAAAAAAAAAAHFDYHTAVAAPAATSV